MISKDSVDFLISHWQHSCSNLIDDYKGVDNTTRKNLEYATAFNSSTSDVMIDYTPDKLPEVRWTQSLSHPEKARLRSILCGASSIYTNQLDGGIGRV